MFSLSAEDKIILLNEIKKDYQIDDESLKNLKNYLNDFKTSEIELTGNFGTYDMNKNGYEGLYGYLKDKLQGHFKYGDSLN